MNSYDDYLTFALGKGRLSNKTMELFEKAGITCEEMKDPSSRKLIFTSEEAKMRFFLSKGPDVPTYVEYGAADIGVVGRDTILEENRNVYEILDLGFGKCRMCVCGPESASDKLLHHERIRVASKYPVIAKEYFNNKKNQTVDRIGQDMRRSDIVNNQIVQVFCQFRVTQCCESMMQFNGQFFHRKSVNPFRLVWMPWSKNCVKASFRVF